MMDAEEPDPQHKKKPNKAAIIGGAAAGIVGTATLGYGIYRGVPGTAKITPKIHRPNPVTITKKCRSKYKENVDLYGEGVYSKVYISCKASNESDCSYVMKIQTVVHSDTKTMVSISIPQIFKQEVERYNILRGLNITPQLHDAYICEETLYTKYVIVLEKLDKTLNQHLRRIMKKDDYAGLFFLDFNAAIDLIEQSQKILTILKKYHVFYTDWHFKNVMLDNNNQLKLIDFGLTGGKRDVFNFMISLFLIPILIFTEGVSSEELEAILEYKDQCLRKDSPLKKSINDKKKRWQKEFGDPNSILKYFLIDLNTYIDNIIRYLKNKLDQENKIV